MKTTISALILTLALASNASAETFHQPVLLKDQLAAALWTLMGPEFTTIPEGARVKQSYTTCLRTAHYAQFRYVCQTLGSDFRLYGAPAEQIFHSIPAHRENNAGNGGVTRGTRITCTQTGDHPPYVHLCAVPQEIAADEGESL